VNINQNKNRMKTNEELRKDVMDEIKWDPELTHVATEIGVAAKDGTIVLSGCVNTFRKKAAAEKAAQRVSGVCVVASDIEVKIGPEGKKTDADIAAAVRNALRWNSAVNQDDVEVKVDNGWVYLEGKTQWDFQRNAIQRLVEDLVGVTGVSNNIAITSRSADSKEIRRKISEAFHRSATVDASSITSESNGSNVVLRGSVRSWAERNDAERVAFAAPGVLTVDNQIKIDVTLGEYAHA
jgi:osmotically-inducible protein OsmY